MTRFDVGDCDGILTADDCDDTDPESTSALDDTDCDGWIASMDCDDADPSIGFTDGDGDGLASTIVMTPMSTSIGSRLQRIRSNVVCRRCRWRWLRFDFRRCFTRVCHHQYV